MEGLGELVRFFRGLDEILGGGAGEGAGLGVVMDFSVFGRRISDSGD